jgi:hypothetical protein
MRSATAVEYRIKDVINSECRNRTRVAADKAAVITIKTLILSNFIVVLA